MNAITRRAEAERLTPAQEIAVLLHQTGIRPKRMAWWIGASPGAMKSWLRQARADGAGVPAPNGRQPQPHWVTAVRLVVALHTACPSLLPAIRAGRETFARELLGVPRLRLSWEPVSGDSVVWDADTDVPYGLDEEDLERLEREPSHDEDEADDAG